MDQTYMKEKPIVKLLLSMSLPMVISMMVNSLYNIVDSFFVAKISEGAMTALSLVFPVQNLVNAVTIGFSIGINAVIAYYLGAEEHERADIAATQGMFLNILHGVLLTVLCIAIMPYFLHMFTSDGEVIALGMRYSRIVFGFSVIIAMAMSFEKIFQSVGKMAATMLCMLSGCIINILLDPLLIFGLGPFPALGIEGAALATGIGQAATLVIYILIYLIRPISVHMRFKYLARQKKIGLKLYAIGIPATLNLALASVLITALNAILAAYSQMYVVILGVYYKLQTFLYLPANGVIQGMRPLIGYNYGAGEHERVKKIYFSSLCMIASIMLLGTVLCISVPGGLMGLFTENRETIEAGAAALRIISAGFIVSAVSVTSSGALEGLGMGLPSLVISLFRYIVVILPAAFLFSRLAGPTGVWNAFWVTELVTAAAAAFIYRKAAGKNAA